MSGFVISWGADAEKCMIKGPLDFGRCVDYDTIKSFRLEQS